MGNIPELEQRELVNYFKLEEVFINSGYKDVLVLILLLKSLSIYNLLEHGRFLLKKARGHAFPASVAQFNTLNYADDLRLYGSDFYKDFDAFIIGNEDYLQEDPA